jgi:hypothetical protein
MVFVRYNDNSSLEGRSSTNTGDAMCNKYTSESGQYPTHNIGNKVHLYYSERKFLSAFYMYSYELQERNGRW